jgi:hypothetical protein
MGNPTNPNRVVRVKDLDRFKSNTDGLYATKTVVATTYATKQEVSDATLIPLNMEQLTPSSTFVKNNVLGINGILYRAKQNTSEFPVSVVTDKGRFVYDTDKYGNKAYVVSDYTLSQAWEKWSDAGISYSLSVIDSRLSYFNNLQIALRLTQIESLLRNIQQTLGDVTVDGQTYTVRGILTELAKLMDKDVVLGDE